MNMARSPGVRHLILASVLSVGAVTTPAHAQNFTTRCRVDTASAWYRAQRDWYAQDSKHDWSNDSLRVALLLAAPKDADDGSFPLQLGAVTANEAAPASAALASARDRLRDLARQRQWPTRSLVGAAGVHAAWLIAQGDSALAGTAMHRMMEAGMGESSPADVAVLEDAVRMAAGRKQLYASHFVRTAKGLEPGPTEDLPHVDMRRDAATLPPLTLATCLAAQNR